ncbi:hypothetical protein BJ170DRAFT_347071 [Xylariales sp. AK1849]|nr:hypothetical protein BJ170DRAFT_347071 [Xylariales sp. AK1849]
MATPPAKDPLDILEAMFKEVLVQTGKALKGSQKDGSRNVISAGSALRTKMPETMTTFHYALDDLESEITRAKAVLLRDLEKLQAARMPVPVPVPVAPPAPMMAEPRRPAAVMMDMPSSAAHTINTNANFQPKEETKRAPFPDMGMGLSADVVDLTAGDKPATASPRVSAGNLKPGAGARTTPPVKQSPKPTPQAKVTPVPPPQIPPQPTAIGPSAPRAAAPPQPPPAVQAAQDSSMDAMLSLPSTGGAATADMTGGGELNFTNMEFSLAPSSDGPSQNAPPAPMQDFDLSSFTQDGGNEMLSMDNFHNAGGNSTNAAPADAATATPAKGPENTAAAGTSQNVDSIYDLGNIGSGNDMDLDLSLGGNAGVNDSTFDDLFFDTNDSDMGQFDNAYFGLE